VSRLPLLTLKFYQDLIQSKTVKSKIYSLAIGICMSILYKYPFKFIANELSFPFLYYIICGLSAILASAIVLFLLDEKEMSKSKAAILGIIAGFSPIISAMLIPFISEIIRSVIADILLPLVITAPAVLCSAAPGPGGTGATNFTLPTPPNTHIHSDAPPLPDDQFYAHKTNAQLVSQSKITSGYLQRDLVQMLGISANIAIGNGLTQVLVTKLLICEKTLTKITAVFYPLKPHLTQEVLMELQHILLRVDKAMPQQELHF
jgi:hypothetical protein